MDLFRDNKCDFNSLTESIDTSTASGRMFIKIIGIFAEFERENIGERVRVGKERKTREGYANNSSQISYGFNREKGELIQTVYEPEAKNVRMIFDMYVNQGMSLSAIAKSLNLQKITSKKGFLWNAATVRSVLTNCNYAGNVRYCMHDSTRNFEVEGKHEAIITEELYQQAQILIEKNAKTAPSKKPAERNYFVNFLYCDDCGQRFLPHNSTYHTKKNGKTTSYAFQCRTRFLKGNCTMKAITVLKVENALTQYFAQFADTFDSNQAESQRLQSEEQNNAAQVQSYRNKLKFYDSKEKEIMGNYTNGIIDFDSYRKLKKQLDDDRVFIRTELGKLNADENGNSRPATIVGEEVAATFRESWQGLTNAEKRLFLTNYVKKIVVRNDPIEGSRYGTTTVTRVEFNSY